MPRPERGHGSPAATLTGATPAGDEREPATASQTEGAKEVETPMDTETIATPSTSAQSAKTG